MMTASRIAETDLLANPERVLTGAERQAVIITQDGRDHVALVPLPEYVRLTGLTLDGNGVDPRLADLIDHFHREEPRFTETLTVDLDVDLVEFIKAEAAAFGCSVDVVISAALKLFIDETEGLKTETITLQASPEEMQLLTAAASLTHQSVGDFVVACAVAEARRVLALQEPTAEATPLSAP